LKRYIITNWWNPYFTYR